jgi:hypothetical protein
LREHATSVDHSGAPPSRPVPATPSCWWYVGFAACIAASILGALAVWLIGQATVAGDVAGFPRIVAPGDAEVELRSGAHVLYFEHRAEVDGVSIESVPAVPMELAIELLDADGQALPLRRPYRDWHYDTADYAGQSVRRVNVDQAGLYELAVAALPTDGIFSVSIGRGDPPSTEGYGYAAWSIAVIGGLFGLSGVLMTGVLRARAAAGL